MVSTAQIMKEYKETPWDLRGLKYERSTFEIVDDITPTTDLKETKIKIEYEKNGIKASFDKKVILIKVKVGIMVKSLGLEKSEYIKMVCMIPPEAKNYKGCSFYFEGDKLTYLQQTTDEMVAEMNANIDRPILPPPQPTQEDQKDAFVRTLVTRIQVLNDMGTDAFMSDVLKLASKICPGKEVEIVGYAKTKGLICELTGGVVKVS